MDKLTADYIWKCYEKGRDHHNAVNMYDDTEKCYRFYTGDQWYGIQSGGEELPVLNFIKPIGKYKISMIAQNKIAIVYSSENDAPSGACEVLNDFATYCWEQLKMDTMTWEVIKSAFVAGDHYVYYTVNKKAGIAVEKYPKVIAQNINRTNIYFADEQNPEIQEQPWIIISERLPVEKVKRIAKQNGFNPDDIVSDEDTKDSLGENKDIEVKTDTGKCLSLLYMRKTDKGGIEYSRSVQNTIYEIGIISNMKLYPIASMRWEKMIGYSRGLSGVLPIIPNQLEVNKTAARRALSIKDFAYPKLAYDVDKLENVNDLDTIGARIPIFNLGGNPIKSVIDYLMPERISPDAASFQDELITATRDLEGAGDAATGAVDPTQASGEAIKAARDQAAVPLNEQSQNFAQFLEDTANIWSDVLCVYVDHAFVVNGEVVTKDQLVSMDPKPRIDITPIDPYSLRAQEIAVERLFMSGQISINEYVDLLDETSSVPKSKLEEMLKKRPVQMPQNPIMPAGLSEPTNIAPEPTGGEMLANM